jgi:BlaI family transcriptional regulator, penicillinase repressor
METLTKKEEEIMQILWKLKKGFVNDIIDELPEPKPPYNTISSIVRILETKGFVDYKAYGKSHQYFPIITKAAYRKFAFKQMISSYFDGSYEKVVSFLVSDEESQLSEKEAEELKKLSEILKKKS